MKMSRKALQRTVQSVLVAAAVAIIRETESKDVLDAFVAAMTQIQQEAEQEPERVKSAPHTMPVRRLDDVRAAKQLDLRWKPTA